MKVYSWVGHMVLVEKVEFDISEIYRSTNSAALSSVVHSQSQQKNGLQAVGDIVEKQNSTISGNY